MSTTQITCPNCKYVGKPKHRTSTLAWWIFFVLFGAISFVIGTAAPIFFIVPFLLFIAAIVGTIINTTKGPLFCPRCRFVNVIPMN